MSTKYETIQVGLLTDFGLRGPYVSEVKCTILSGVNASRVTIIDISHSIERHNVFEGAYVLYAASRSFANGSLLLGVVDPGVGTQRKPIIVKSKNRTYVGPDNGLLIPSAKADGGFEVFKIRENLVGIERTSEVFHGRDIFAKVINLLLSGKTVEQLGEPVDDYVDIELFKYEVDEDELRGVALFVDDFGNIITNISPSNEVCKRAKSFEISTKAGVFKAAFVKAYDFVASGELLVTIGSQGFLEVAVNRGSADKVLDLRAGDRICLRGISV